jgi:site-specific recombinase XerD
MVRKVKNRTKPNRQVFSEYFAIIGNSYSPAYFKEAHRLMGQYHAFIGEAPPSMENFSDFFLRYRDLKPNSRARYHNAFSAFFKWYSGDKLPFSVKSAKLTPQLVSECEVDQLRSSLVSKRSHKTVLERDLLMIDLMCNAGLRRGEIANLRLRNMKLDGDISIMIKEGKGAKDRMVPLNPDMAARLKAFTAGKAPDDHVFNLSGKSISSKFNLWAKKAGVPQLHPHSFRHKFATDLLLRGADLRTVQELLGHESLEVTQRYLAVTDASKRWAIGLLAKPPITLPSGRP